MKILLTSFNEKLGVNPMVSRLFDPMPEFQRAGVHDCEAVFLSFIAPECDFVPDKLLIDAVSRRHLPVVIFDHTETFPENYIFPWGGLERESHYDALRNVILSHMDVKAYFKREISASKASYNNTFTFPLYPLDWTLSHSWNVPEPKVDTRDEYNARPIDIFMSWGYSNESRPKLMGELLRRAGDFSAHFCLTEQDLTMALQEKRERIFALLFTPHTRRIHIKQLLEWQQLSKISISMFGAGKKCFRCAEAPYNSLMAQEAPEMVQWSYPWIPDTTMESCNCVGLRYMLGEGDWVNSLYSHLRVNQGSLYDIYLRGIENAKHYRNTTYAREYLLPKLQKALS